MLFLFTSSLAMAMATEQFKSAKETTSSLSNRVFFLTDMEVGSTDGEEFQEFVAKNSANSISSTVIGVGLDLSNGIIDKVSKTNGCN